MRYGAYCQVGSLGLSTRVYNSHLLDTDNVARYCPKRKIADDGIPMEEAFRLRKHINEQYLSTNWLEYFRLYPQRAQIDCVIQSLSTKLKIDGEDAIVVLNVGAATQRCSELAQVNLKFINFGRNDDPSYTGIYGYTEHNAKVALALAKLDDRDLVYRVNPDTT